MKNKEKIYNIIEREYVNNQKDGVDTKYIANELGMIRSNVSQILNDLVEQGRLCKRKGKPVLYFPNNKDTSCFNQLIGFDKSLKEPIKLAKAALLYPNRSLYALLVTHEGDVFESFIDTMHKFSCENLNINPKKFTRISYQDLYMISTYDIDDSDFILIDNLQTATNKDIIQLYDFLNKHNNKIIIGRVILKDDNNILEDLLQLFEIIIRLPLLSEISFEERYDYINCFFQNESLKVRRTIRVNANILACLLVYKCERNIKQLANDIRITCANAYVKQKQAKDVLYVTLDDLQPNVRKGLLYVEKNKEYLRKIIDLKNVYVYSSTEVKIDFIEDKHNKTFYEYIDERINALQNEGLSENEIQEILKNSIQEELKEYMELEVGKEFDANKLSKIVDKQIIELTSSFLSNASCVLNKVFSSSVYYGLCLHIHALVNKRSQEKTYEQYYYLKFITSYEKEYNLIHEFAEKLKKYYQIEISEAEKLYLTLFLVPDSAHEFSKASILVAMHGEHIATSICNVVKTFIPTDNIYPFDMNLDLEMDVIYHNLKQLLIQIDRGNGIVAIYDMGSLRVMLSELKHELNCNIKLIEVPVTQMILDITRKVESGINIEELNEKNLIELYTNKENQEVNSHRLHQKRYSIITVCMSGHGGAEQIKNYVQQEIEDKYKDDVAIIPLGIANKETMMKEINAIKKETNILCIIGTFNPKLFRIPFISISQLFDAKSSELVPLLRLNMVNEITKEEYQRLFKNMKFNFDMEFIQKYMPEFITTIGNLEVDLDKNRKLGIVMHISSCIARLISGTYSCDYCTDDKLIQKNKRLYYLLKDKLHIFETEYHIVFPEQEYVNLIQMIKQK